MISSHILPSIELATPRSARCCYTLGKVVVSTTSGEVAAEEGKDIIYVRKVHLGSK
jgi:hypothetical protein